MSNYSSSYTELQTLSSTKKTKKQLIVTFIFTLFLILSEIHILSTIADRTQESDLFLGGNVASYSANFTYLSNSNQMCFGSLSCANVICNEYTQIPATQYVCIQLIYANLCGYSGIQVVHRYWDLFNSFKSLLIFLSLSVIQTIVASGCFLFVLCLLNTNKIFMVFKYLILFSALSTVAAIISIIVFQCNLVTVLNDVPRSYVIFWHNFESGFYLVIFLFIVTYTLKKNKLLQFLKSFWNKKSGLSIQ